MNVKSVKISVYIAFYNAENFAERALDSVLNQTFNNFELICIDDGSTDATYKILNEYSEKDNRIKVFLKSHGGIPAASFNYAIDRSSGEYVFVIGHDDQISEDALEKMYQRAVQTNADCVIPDLYYSVEYDPSATRRQVGYKGDRQIILTNKEAVIYSLKWDVHGFCLFRGDIVRRIRFTETGMNTCEYSVREFFLNCNKVVFSEGTYIYNVNRYSITGKLSLKSFDVVMTNYLLLNLLKKNDFNHDIVQSFEIECFTRLSNYYWIFIKTGYRRFSYKDRQHIGVIFRKTYLRIDKIALSKALLEHGNKIELMILRSYSSFVFWTFIRHMFITIKSKILWMKNTKIFHASL